MNKFIEMLKAQKAKKMREVILKEEVKTEPIPEHIEEKKPRKTRKKKSDDN